MYLERREPKTNWDEAFDELRAVRRSSRLIEGWERDGARLFLAPRLYSEAVLIQYLVSRSQSHGGMTVEGRLTLMELIRRLRYSGYLDEIRVTEREPGEVFEKLIDHLASTHEWGYGTAHGREQVTAGAKKAKPKKAAKTSAKKSSKSRKGKLQQPEPDVLLSEPVKLHYVVDRRDFLEKVKSVYAAYAG
jgi:hypothetical protein